MARVRIAPGPEVRVVPDDRFSGSGQFHDYMGVPVEYAIRNRGSLQRVVDFILRREKPRPQFPIAFRVGEPQGRYVPSAQAQVNLDPLEPIVQAIQMKRQQQGQ